LTETKHPKANSTLWDFAFTVFTPTYNRAYTLHRVWESLNSQTFRNFEWVIVDDGSTDETGQMVQNWQKQADFPIRYEWQLNAGKHNAVNKGVSFARGEIFVIFDSDDACTPDALATFWQEWHSTPVATKQTYMGLLCTCQDQYGNLVGPMIPTGIKASDLLTLTYRYKAAGERWLAIRTEVMREYPFPAISGLTHIPEGVVWLSMAQRYQVLLIDKPLRIYFINHNPDQLCSPVRSLSSKYTDGTLLSAKTSLETGISWFFHAPKAILRYALEYGLISFVLGRSVVQQWNEITSLGAKLAWLAMLPFAYFRYCKSISFLKSDS